MIRASIGLVALLATTRALAFSCSINPVQIPLQAKNGISVKAQSNDLVFGISIARTDTEAWGGDLPGGATDLVLTGQKIEIEDYEVKKVDDGPDRRSTDGNFGVGANSSLIQYLKDDDKIPARSYGLGYSPGAKSPSDLKMVSIVLGGYDSAAVDGKFFEQDLAADTRLGVAVEITQMTVISPNGDRTKLLERPIAAKLNNELKEILVPSAIAMDYSRLVSGSEYDTRHLKDFVPPWMLEPQSYHILRQSSMFTGSLSISLSNGFTATVPSELLSSNYTGSDSASTIISSILSVNLDHIVLGTVFLSQAYLAVDYENMKLSLAQRSTKSSSLTKRASSLEALGCNFESSESDEDEPSNQRTVVPSSLPAATSSPTPTSSSPKSSSSPSKNTLLGAILGTLLGVIFILALILLFLKRRKRNQRLGYNRRRLSLHSTKGLGYHQYLGASNSRLLSTDHISPSTKQETSTIAKSEFPAPPPPPPPPRASFTPRGSGVGLGRNSYFKEDLDGP